MTCSKSREVLVACGLWWVFEPPLDWNQIRNAQKRNKQDKAASSAALRLGFAGLFGRISSTTRPTAPRRGRGPLPGLAVFLGPRATRGL
jgi:hypothetical protein